MNSVLVSSLSRAAWQGLVLHEVVTHELKYQLSQ